MEAAIILAYFGFSTPVTHKRHRMLAQRRRKTQASECIWRLEGEGGVDDWLYWPGGVLMTGKGWMAGPQTYSSLVAWIPLTLVAVVLCVPVLAFSSPTPPHTGAFVSLPQHLKTSSVFSLLFLDIVPQSLHPIRVWFQAGHCDLPPSYMYVSHL